MAIVPSREYNDVALALKRFPNAETVSRDGYTVFANAIRDALPEAAQVSDRFHLAKNPIDAGERYLSKIIPFVIVPKRPEANELGIHGKMTSREKKLLENYQKKPKVFNEVNKLQAEGLRAATVARQLGLKDSWVRKYYGMAELSPHSLAMGERESMLNPFKPFILDMVKAEARTSKIVAALREQGCKSADSRIRGYISKITRDGVDNTKARFTRRDVLRLLYRPATSIRDEELRDKVIVMFRQILRYRP